MFRALLTTVKTCVLPATLLLVVVPAALAHSHPVTMLPAADSTVAAPAEVDIHFSEGLEPKFSSITVTTGTGHVVNTEPSKLAADDNKFMHVPLPTLAPGIYSVNWVAVAVDGHRSQGEYKFTVK